MKSLNVQHSLTFDGAKGQAKIEKIMDGVRYVLQRLGNSTIVLKKDYLNGIDGLPKSNVIKLFLDDKNSIIFRPSGTEPKIKIYFSIISTPSAGNRQTISSLTSTTSVENHHQKEYFFSIDIISFCL